jgi:hypothetical protein
MESATSQEIMSRQLVRIAAELRDLGLFANASSIDPGILADFRSAVDHARSTAWAVQHCLQEHHENLDVYPILVRERIRRVMELCDVLIKDLKFPQTNVDAEAKNLLHKSVKRMCDHLQYGLR